MPTVEVTCPEGVSEGELLDVEYEGATWSTRVPSGVQSGAMFAVELDIAAAQPEPVPDYDLEPAEPEAEELETARSEAEALESELETPTVSKPAAVPGAAAGLSVLMAAVAQRRLSPANAQARIFLTSFRSLPGARFHIGFGGRGEV